ncbi:MAG: SufE family protein [Bacteroidales bacterium]|nr:SufE family protein [Bacteroidales bacterium]
MTITDIQNKISEEFAVFDDWIDKYNLLVEMGKDLPLIDARYKTNNHLISGCQSKVWLHAAYEDGKVIFTADSDAVITRGIISLLIRMYSGQKPEDILNSDLSFLDDIGLKDQLSPNRSNGLLSMIKQMKLYAQVFKLKSDTESNH